jgi:sulfur-oxidizing protein SoxZ
MPAQARAGEVIEIKALISHAMEAGGRKDAAGHVVPRRIIHEFIAIFDGEIVLQAELSPAISANPYQAFFYRAEKSGIFEFVWKDDTGAEYRTKVSLRVAS